MTDRDKQLLAEFDYNIVSTETFLKRFSVDITRDSEFVKAELRTAIDSSDPDEIQMTLALVWLSGDISKYIDFLNELLLNRNHRSHQQVARVLQDNPSPTTVPFVRKVLESNFDYLEYTCSDTDAIAKWFSWLLYSIGTTEAIDLIKEYSSSKDEGIRKEMLYRLSKIR
jgi:hypothetical protein